MELFGGFLTEKAGAGKWSVWSEAIEPFVELGVLANKLSRSSSFQSNGVVNQNHVRLFTVLDLGFDVEIDVSSMLHV